MGKNFFWSHSGPKYDQGDKNDIGILQNENRVRAKLKELKGNKNLNKVDSFNGEKSYIITDYQPLVNNERIVVNAFQCLEIPS